MKCVGIELCGLAMFRVYCYSQPSAHPVACAICRVWALKRQPRSVVLSLTNVSTVNDLSVTSAVALKPFEVMVQLFLA